MTTETKMAGGLSFIVRDGADAMSRPVKPPAGEISDETTLLGVAKSGDRRVSQPAENKAPAVSRWYRSY
jgi:hypothetical protein